MTISDEAVEAAAGSFHHDWDTTPEVWRAVGRERIRDALKAAAPHMLAEAWYRGAMEMAMQTGDSLSDDLLAVYKRNPYGPPNDPASPAIAL